MANTYKAISSVIIGSEGSSQVNFNNIPQTYTDLVIVVSARQNAASWGGGMRAFFNGYSFTGRRTFGGGGSSVPSTVPNIEVSGDSATSNTFTPVSYYIPNYTDNKYYKANFIDWALQNDSITDYYLGFNGFQTSVTDSNPNKFAPITNIYIVPTGGTLFKHHTTITVYGVFNADVSSAPATPTIGTATAGGGYVDVSFTGVSNAASYTVESSPGSITATGTTSPIRVPVGSGGLTTGTSYTFTVKSNNPFGSSANSSATGSVTAVNTTIIAIPQTTTAAKYSQDAGATWNSTTLPAQLGGQALGLGAGMVYGNGYFVYVPYNTNNAYYSTTGIGSWTSVALPYTAFQSTVTMYTPGSGFLCFSMYDSGRTVKSTNGTSWSAGPSTSAFANVAWSQGYVAAAGKWYGSNHSDPYGGYASSWAGTYTVNTTFSGSPYFWSSGVAASNGTTALHTANYDTGTQLWYTTTGTSLTLGTLPSTVRVGSQVYGNEAGTYLATGSGTVAITSTDGTTWTTRTKPSAVGTSYPVYSKDTGFVAIPWQNNAGNSAYSADGITWTLGGVPAINMYAVASGQVINYSQTTI